MNILIIRTKLVKDSKEIEFIQNLFPTTIVECEQYLDVIKAVKDNRFDILHFPSHGDVNQLLLKTGILSTKMFDSALRNPLLVFVNACSTITMASVLNTRNSISWRIEVSEEIAIKYSNYFYTALFASNNIKQAHEAACEMISMTFPNEEFPILLHKPESEVKKENLDKFIFNISGDINTLIGQQK